MSRKKIFVIYPPSNNINREERCQQHFKEYLQLMALPPTDLMYLAAVAERAGYEAKIEDYSLSNKSLEDFISDLQEYKPNYLIFDVSLPNLKNDLSICEIIKINSPLTIIIAKGFSFSYNSKNIMEKYPKLDYAIQGEPEITLEELLSGKDLNAINGLIWRNNGEIMINLQRELLNDLDSLPFPARHLIDNSKYKRPDNNKPLAVIRVEKGCPYGCFFCLVESLSGKSIRFRNPDNIVKEIKECIEKYNIKNFVFWADLFIFDKEWVKELCNKILAENLKISWSATTRVNTIDYEIAKLMKKSGCKYICMGVENGNQEALDRANKNLDLQQVKMVHKVLKKVGLKTLTHYIIGLPWETEDTINDTIKFAVTLNSNYASFNIATPFPETKFYDYVVEKGLLDKDAQRDLEAYSESYYVPNIKTQYLDKDKVFVLYKKAIKSFYLRPSHMLKTLSDCTSLTSLYGYFKVLFGLLKNN